MLTNHGTLLEFGDVAETKRFFAFYQDALHEYATMSFADKVVGAAFFH